MTVWSWSHLWRLAAAARPCCSYSCAAWFFAELYWVFFLMRFRISAPRLFAASEYFQIRTSSGRGAKGLVHELAPSFSACRGLRLLASLTCTQTKEELPNLLWVAQSMDQQVDRLAQIQREKSSGPPRAWFGGQAEEIEGLIGWMHSFSVTHERRDP